MPPKKHYCDLDLGSDSMLPKKTSLIGRALRALRKLGQLNQRHPGTFEHYRSYSAVVAERQKKLLEDGGNVIHPLSLFSLFWMSVMILVNVLHICLSIFRLFLILEPLESLDVHVLDLVMLAIYCFCFVDIIIKFNTGYVIKYNSHVVMSRRSICWNYLRCWFLVDLASCVPAAYVLLRLRAGPRYILVAHVLPVLRIARIYSVTRDSKVFMRIFTNSYIVHGLVRLAVLFVISVHWCTCLMYSPTIFIYYWTGKMPNLYHHYMGIEEDENLMLYDIQIRYNKAMVISISAFYGTGFTMFRSYEPEEIFIHSLVILYAAMFMIYTIVFLVKTYFTIYGSSVRIEELMNQVEEYMKYRQFPLSLKKRVRAFYQYRYQDRYFKVETDTDYLSEKLRDEVKLYTCRTLANKVKLFMNVQPSVVGTILGCLRPEVYLSNDLVVRAGDIGDCMYFIATGTVAVYSLKGVEVCHLEDGDYFGEVALLMKDSKRVATVVAVENTQLYRLDALDFNRLLLTQPKLYGRIEKMASRRMHETALLDDTFRRDRGEQNPLPETDSSPEVTKTS